MDNSILFFKIWKNKVIKNEIFFHLRLYNVHFNQELAFTITELSNYKYRNYLNRIVIKKKNDEEEEIMEPFPYGIRRIKFSSINLKQLVKMDETTIPTTVDVIVFFFCEIDKANVIPSSVKRVEIISGKIEKGVLPNSIETLDISYYKKPLGIGDLPSSVTSINFGNGFNQSLKGNWLPLNIKSLKFEGDFRRPFEEIKSCLPKSLTCLDLPERYNFLNYSELKKNDRLLICGNLESLSFNYSLNQPIEKEVLPNSLTTLSFGNNFNQPIEKEVLPNGLTTLSFGYYFNQPIGKGILPNNLKTLTFGYHFNQPIKKEVLPNSLTTLSFGIQYSYYNQPIEKEVLPNNLTNLSFGDHFNQMIEKGVLPNSLTTLSFGSDFNKPIEKEVLPNNLKTLSFGRDFNQSIEKEVLPNNLTTLSFGFHFNQSIKKEVLPNGLTTLSFGHSFNHPIEKEVLPSNLTTLSFRGFFNRPIEKEVLPNNLTSLSLGTRFDHPLEVGVLPKNLKNLNFISSTFKQDFSSSFDDYQNLESISINKDNLQLINNLNSNFFTKYIKLTGKFDN
ncbi:hypothetical protein ACTA71_007329 [Dictyostelium dimigraforme]